MSSLSPPPSPGRHRASSTGRRPPLTLKTCSSRKRASSVSSVTAVQPPTPITLVAPQAAASILKSPKHAFNASSMLPVFLSRSLQLLDIPNHHAKAPSTSYSDDSILPLSASPTSTTFGDIFVEKSPFPSGFPSIHAPLLLVIILFPLTTLTVLLALASLPVSVSWPRTLNDLAQMGRELHTYSQSGNLPLAHVIGVMSVTAVWKHAWSIPGSVIWNVLAGALFHPAWATLLLTLLTTIGSIFATLFSRPMAPLLSQWFPRALSITRNALQGDPESPSTTQSRTAAWVRLSILRLIGVVPWSGINIACGVCGVSISDCFLGSFIGALPWTAVTCQIGDILQTVATTPSTTPKTVSSLLTSPDIVLKLILLTFISLAPILGRDRLRAWVSRSSSEPESEKETEERRFQWVAEWRSKIRSSRSQSRRSSESEEDILKKDTLP